MEYPFCYSFLKLISTGFANREKLHIFAKSIGEFVEGMTTLIAPAVPSPKV